MSPRGRAALAGIALATVVGLAAASCRETEVGRISGEVFRCDPDAPTADHDCGDGYLCYSVMETVGASVCVPRCDPADRESCAGVCTSGGECLRTCAVSDPTSCRGPGAIMSCVRRTVSPLAGKSDDGVCLPVNRVCSAPEDCSSPVENLCSSEVRLEGSPDLTEGGGLCIQGGCSERGTACAPGSSCLRYILPESLGTPDACLANCLGRRLASGATILECPVTTTCLADALPQSGVLICTPGFVGWMCIDDFGCQGGRCQSWRDVSPSLDRFRSCAPPCRDDDDCLLYRGRGNPNGITRVSCRAGSCRTLFSLLYPAGCLRHNEACALDPQASCQLGTDIQGQPDGGVNLSDGGVTNPACFGRAGMVSALSGDGSFGLCSRPCETRADCAALAGASGLPFTCITPPFGGDKVCVPSIPLLTPCDDDSVCMGLRCLPAPDGFGSFCSLPCARHEDCDANVLIGGIAACQDGACVFRTPSGCPDPDGTGGRCLARLAQDGRCVSPARWPCAQGAECSSGRCSGTEGCE